MIDPDPVKQQIPQSTNTQKQDRKKTKTIGDGMAET